MMVNGNQEPLPEGAMSLARFLEHKGLHPGGVVVERNGEVVARARFGQVILEDADTLEILRFVGGGC